MTTIRKIVTSKIDGNDANANSDNEIRPFGETAFYVDNDGPTNKLVLSIHDGVRTHIKSKVLGPGVMYGSGADSGDGEGFDTIKLIPDATLHYDGSDQYLVIDPTQPNHIHIRAGGTIDNSSADLYLGGELTSVRVSDSYDNVRVRTSITGEGVTNYDWTFDNTGKLTLPQGGAIEAHGMGWTGLTNGTSGTPLSIAYKSNTELPVGLAEILLIGSSTDGSVGIYTQDTVTEISNQWVFDATGDLTFPGSSNAKIGEDEPGLVIRSGNGVAVLTNADITNTHEVEFIGYVHNGVGDGPGATLTVTEIVAGTITDGMTIYGTGLPPEGWTVTIGGVPNAGSGGTGNYLLSGANILTSSQSFNNGVFAAGSQSWIFSDNGELSFPNGITIPGGVPSLIVETGNNLGVGTSRYQTQSANCNIAVGDEFVADTEFNDDITVVQVGWTVNVGGTDYTVTAIDPAPPANQYRITAAGATFVQGTTYTFINPTPVASTWVFGNDGTLTTPASGTISHQNNDLMVEVAGTDVIVLRTEGGDVYVDAAGVLNTNQANINFLNFGTNDNIQVGQTGGGRFQIAMDRFQVLSAVPTTSIGINGDTIGCVAFDGLYIYYCTAPYDSVTNIWKRVAWSGDTW